MTCGRIHEQLKSEGIPVRSVREDPAGVFTATLDASATQPQRDRAAALCANPPPLRPLRRLDFALALVLTDGAAAPLWARALVQAAADRARGG